MSSSSASFSPLPSPNTSPLMFSTRPIIGVPTRRAMCAARFTSLRLSLCGVVTRMIPVRFATCMALRGTSLVPGGKSNMSASRAPHSTRSMKSVSKRCLMGPRMMMLSSSVRNAVDDTLTPW